MSIDAFGVSVGDLRRCDGGDAMVTNACAPYAFPLYRLCVHWMIDCWECARLHVLRSECRHRRAWQQSTYEGISAA
jgi:hypothetical protein